MRALIAGVDGYLGWSLAQHLVQRGHQVGGLDNFSRRRWVEEMGSWSAIPIATIDERREAFASRYGVELELWQGDLCDYALVARAFEEFRPDAIIHLGECPSGPYSMIDRDHAVFVQTNNVVSTFNLLFAIRDLAPATHLLKLGTMGEYGTPQIPIAEGFFEVEYRGRRDVLPFPRQAGSWYHWSKVHGSNNVMFACRMWNIRATDVMQGVVFGTRIDGKVADQRLNGRFDFDQAFGTAINRFCCQAVLQHPLTPYGIGHQRRGFIPLRDSMQCLTLALENPPAQGEYRVFNQFESVYEVAALAGVVQEVASSLGMPVPAVRHVENPRIELEEHFYEPDHGSLLELGYQPSHDLEVEVATMLEDLYPHRDRIAAKSDVLIPDVCWDGHRERRRFVDERSLTDVLAERIDPASRGSSVPDDECIGQRAGLR